MTKKYDDKFNKFHKIIDRIEMLTELIKKEPEDRTHKRKLKKAEDGLARIIKEQEKEIERYLKTLNDEESWEE